MTVATGDPEWMILEGTRLSFNKLHQLNTRQRKTAAQVSRACLECGTLIENCSVLENPD
jgi:hypothetical protein